MEMASKHEKKRRRRPKYEVSHRKMKQQCVKNRRCSQIYMHFCETHLNLKSTLSRSWIKIAVTFFIICFVSYLFAITSQADKPWVLQGLWTSSSYFYIFLGSLSGFFCFLLVCCFWTGTLVHCNFPRWQLTQISSASWLAGGELPPLLIISSPLHWVITGLGI